MYLNHSSSDNWSFFFLVRPVCFAQADGSTSRGAVNPPRLHHTPVLEFVMASWLLPVGVFFWGVYDEIIMDNVSKANINTLYISIMLILYTSCLW